MPSIHLTNSLSRTHTPQILYDVPLVQGFFPAARRSLFSLHHLTRLDSTQLEVVDIFLSFSHLLDLTGETISAFFSGYSSSFWVIFSRLVI